MIAHRWRARLLRDAIDLAQSDFAEGTPKWFVTLPVARTARREQRDREIVGEHSSLAAGSAARLRALAKSECGLTSDQCPVAGLREALAREEVLLREKSELIRQQEVLGHEASHRLLNSLQIVSSLLSMQARSAVSAEAASQLAAASKRVAAVGRIHQRLHNLDGVHGVAFKQYLQDICHDFSPLLSSQDLSAGIAVEAIELTLPTTTAIPFGFIVSELITNAIKYGNGRITVRLEPSDIGRYALSVSNDGPALPNEFDPAASKGLGMRIIRSFVEQIGGELRIGSASGGQGARFTVLFLPVRNEARKYPPDRNA